MIHLTTEQIEAMDGALKAYDVDQAHWEHEPLGFDVNAGHVLKHLVRDLSRKDFFDTTVVRQELAPDSLQYALRLARWSGYRRDALQSVTEATKLEMFSRQLRLMSPRIGAYMLAQSWLADWLHDREHVAEAAKAQSRQMDMVGRVGQLLVFSAKLAAQEFEFNLPRAFDLRLEGLRERLASPSQPIE